jgi:hypothetical protein
MICPHCSASIKYKERSGETCSKCNKKFAFEPKTHSLQLTDTRFLKVIGKLSSDQKFYFTKSQLQFALSRKKLNSNTALIVIIILAIVSSIVSIAIFPVLLFVTIPFWIMVIIAKLIYSKRNVSLPQTPSDFESTVLDRWLRVYHHYPSKLITEMVIPNNFNEDLKGTLVCEDPETAMCLFKNNLGKNLKLAIVSAPKAIAELSKNLRVLPIYVLHEASADGYLFLEKIKGEFGRDTKVIDIGFRPQSVMKSKLMQLRQPTALRVTTSGLTAHEIKWLNQGSYVPLFVLKPEKLIKYVTNQIRQKSKFVQSESVESKAKAVGFMTWAGEK